MIFDGLKKSEDKTSFCLNPDGFTDTEDPSLMGWGCRPPFVKKFSDDGFFYVYDVNTNQIIEVEKPVYDIIDSAEPGFPPVGEAPIPGTNQGPGLNQALDRIKQARIDHGLFSSFKPKAVTMGIKTAEGVRELHEHGFRQLILQITSCCDLNCAYCPTSGKYSPPKSSLDHMSIDTCKKAVDFFSQKITGDGEIFITFYGGEPLTRFDLIVDTIEYVKTKFKTGKFSFNLTTNATLLNKKILDFFIENDFRIMVSLDGPGPVHDRYRRYKNRKGTFNRIMKNLEFLKGYNSEYFCRSVSISGVLAPPYDQIDDILEFFSTHPTLKEIKGNIRSSLVNTEGTTFFEDFGLEESARKYPDVEKKLDLRLKEAILSGNLGSLTIEKSKIFNILYNLARKPITKLHEYAYPFGACHMGLKRLFVTTKGDLHICERSGNEYRIGNLETGFDYERIAYYYKKLEEVLDGCKNCWAQNHCERCWVLIGNLEEFNGEKRDRFCFHNKWIIEKAFKFYTQLLRENPDSLRVFKDVKVG